MRLINKTVAAAVIAALSLTVNAAPEDAARFHHPNDGQPTKAQTQVQNQPKVQTETKAGNTVQKDVSELKVDASSLRNTATTEERARAAAQLADVAEQSQNPSSGSGNPVRINKSNVIRVNPGENVFIPISREHPNRIITPFKNPQVISSSLSEGTKKGECGELCVRNGVVYVTTDARQAVTTFITERGNEKIAFSVTMIPQAIPPRQVTFNFPDKVMDELRGNTQAANLETARQWEEGLPYVETIKSAMRMIALGQVPDGYSMRKTVLRDRIPTCKQSGLKFTFRPGQTLEGYNLNFYVGVIENVSGHPVEFLELNCGSWQTAAVASWPLKVLRPGQKTEIYLAAKKGNEETDVKRVRKPLIEREYR